MEKTKRNLTLRILRGIKDVSSEDWNALACHLDTPILNWEWLYCLEESGSIGPSSGWLPCHFFLSEDDSPVAAAPLYIRTDSWGDFSYDHMWHDAANQLGKPFYPKLVGMSPATPSEGYRFLIAPGEDVPSITALLLNQIDEFCKDEKIASLNLHFTEPLWKDVFENCGLVPWKHQTYIWTNENFSSFEDYLSLFSKNQRRNIRRERKSMETEGVDIKVLEGDELTEKLFARMYHYFDKTNNQFGFWAARFVNGKFFEMLYEYFRNSLALITAFKEGADVAMGFLLKSDDRIIGRYWGTDIYLKDLHFNVCYYAPIQWAIEKGIKIFDPGIGSEHKIRRGFKAFASYSYHRHYDPVFHRVFKENVPMVDEYVDNYIGALNKGLPFKK